MSVQEQPQKAVVSVVQMAEMLDLSKSRLFALIQAGVFPKPIRHTACKRPVFDAELQRKCLGIRQTGIAFNGQPVLFNRKRRKVISPKARQDHQPISKEQVELVEALKSLGLTVKPEEVQTVVRELYPNGWNEIDFGEVVRRVFLQLRPRK